MHHTIRKMIAESTRPRMGSSDEVKERWPHIDGTNPDNWTLLEKFVAKNPPENYEPCHVYADVNYNGQPDAIVRIYYLEGSDHATWAIITDPTDTRFLAVDDLGD